MGESTAFRVWRMAAWLMMPALPAVAYFAAYYTAVTPVDTRIRIRPGSTRTIRLDTPEPMYSVRAPAGVSLSSGFWQRFFGPAWRVDRIVRPGVWRPGRVVKQEPSSSFTAFSTAGTLSD